MNAGARVALAVALASSVLGACRDDGSSASASTTLRVYAATSLQEAFTELARGFRAVRDDVEIELTFGGSSGLAAQIQQGAPAHVFATADRESMAPVIEAAAEGSPAIVFARNRLALVVEPDNPKGLTSVRDVARDDVVLVLCAPAVPCGRLAAAALRRAGVDGDVEASSLEENVGAVRSKVELGEADAGFVYATDVLAAGDAVDEIHDPVLDADELEAIYPMVVLDGAPVDAAAAWLAYVRSSQGRELLDRLGFLAP